MLAQISLIGAGLAVACPPPAGWLGDQGGVVDRGEFVTTAMEAGRSKASGGMLSGELAAVTIGIRDVGIARVRCYRSRRASWPPARVSALRVLRIRVVKGRFR